MKALLDIARPAVVGATDLPVSNIMIDKQTKTTCEVSSRNTCESRGRSEKSSIEKKSSPVAGDTKADRVTPKSLDNVVIDPHIPKVLEELKEDKFTEGGDRSAVSSGIEKVGLVIRKRKMNVIVQNAPEVNLTVCSLYLK